MPPRPSSLRLTRFPSQTGVLRVMASESAESSLCRRSAAPLALCCLRWLCRFQRSFRLSASSSSASCAMRRGLSFPFANSAVVRGLHEAGGTCSSAQGGSEPKKQGDEGGKGGAPHSTFSSTAEHSSSAFPSFSESDSLLHYPPQDQTTENTAEIAKEANERTGVPFSSSQGPTAVTSAGARYPSTSERSTAGGESSGVVGGDEMRGGLSSPPPPPLTDTEITVSSISGEDFEASLVWPLGDESPALTSSQRSLYATVRSLRAGSGSCAVYGALRVPATSSSRREVPLLPFDSAFCCGGGGGGADRGKVCCCTALLYLEPPRQTFFRSATAPSASLTDHSSTTSLPIALLLLQQQSDQAAETQRRVPLRAVEEALTRSRDQVLLGLQLAPSVEQGFREFVATRLGEDVYEQLMGNGLSAAVVNLCAGGLNQYLRAREAGSQEVVGKGTVGFSGHSGASWNSGTGFPERRRWQAKTLVSVRDQNRLLFLLEKTSSPEQLVKFYGDELNLTSLYTLWSLASASRTGSSLEASKEEGNPSPSTESFNSCLSASLAPSVKQVVHVIQEMMAREGKPREAMYMEMSLRVQLANARRVAAVQQAGYASAEELQTTSRSSGPCRRSRTRAGAGLRRRPNGGEAVGMTRELWMAGAGLELWELSILCAMTQAQPGLISIFMKAVRAVLKRLELELEWTKLCYENESKEAQKKLQRGARELVSEATLQDAPPVREKPAYKTWWSGFHLVGEEERRKATTSTTTSRLHASLSSAAVELQQLGVSALLWGVVKDLERLRHHSSGAAASATDITNSGVEPEMYCEGGEAGGMRVPATASPLPLFSEEVFAHVDVELLCGVVSDLLALRSPLPPDTNTPSRMGSTASGFEPSPRPNGTHQEPLQVGRVIQEGLCHDLRQCFLQLLTVMNLEGEGGQGLRMVVRWLLVEAPLSEATMVHFGELAAYRQGIALEELRLAGLMVNAMQNEEEAIVQATDVLLPLLLQATSPEFLTTAINEVLTRLESRLHQQNHPHQPPPSSSTKNGHRYGKSNGMSPAQEANIFTPTELDRLADFGTALFTLGENAGDGEAPKLSFETFGSRLEEIEVMDGSPVALFRTIYHWIRYTLPNDIKGLAPQQKHPGKKGKATSSQATEKTPSGGGTPAVEERSSSRSPNSAEEEEGRSAIVTTTTSSASLPRFAVPYSVRQRFLSFLEDLIHSFVMSQRPVASTRLLEFVNLHVPVPNIQDEYRRKLYFLVNVTAEPGSSLPRPPSSPHPHPSRWKAEDEAIPQELRLLVSSLPHTLSPYASVAILRDVLSQSAGRNPRYTYVCNAALDLQLPVSTTRSRVATAMNMWSFLNSQSDKLSYGQLIRLQKRCLVNFPLSYIWSSYWVILSWTGVLLLVAMHFFGMDYESSLLANHCQRAFGLPEELAIPLPAFSPRHVGHTAVEGAELKRPVSREEHVHNVLTRVLQAQSEALKAKDQAEAADKKNSPDETSLTTSDGNGSDVETNSGEEPSRNPTTPSRRNDPFSTAPSPVSPTLLSHWLSSTLASEGGAGGTGGGLAGVLSLVPVLSSLLGSDRGRLKSTLFVLGSDDALDTASFSFRTSYQKAVFLIEKVTSALRFPFFVEMEKPLSVELLEARVAERMRRVSSNQAYFWLRPIVRFFPLGLQKTEVSLIEHTCLRADRSANRVTFIVYIHDGVPVTLALLQKLRKKSCLSRKANVVVVTHEGSLERGGVTARDLEFLQEYYQYDVQHPMAGLEKYPHGRGVASNWAGKCQMWWHRLKTTFIRPQEEL